jgi:hypothetical protein
MTAACAPHPDQPAALIRAEPRARAAGGGALDGAAAGG